MFVMRIVDKINTIIFMVWKLVMVSLNIGWSKRRKYWFPFLYFYGALRKIKS